MSTVTLSSKFVSNCRAILDVFRDTCARTVKPPIDGTTFSLIDVSLGIIDGEGMLKYYAKETSKFWDKIDLRDDSYVCNNVDVILNSVTMDSKTRDLISSLINSDKMRSVIALIHRNDENVADDEKDMVYIWSALTALIKLSIKYVDDSRKKNPSALPDITFDLETMKAKYL